MSWGYVAFTGRKISVYEIIQTECGKMRTRYGHFLRSPYLDKN